jgi:hypothetical protein
MCLSSPQPPVIHLTCALRRGRRSKGPANLGMRSVCTFTRKLRCHTSHSNNTVSSVFQRLELLR